jgi:hypothetical protein
MNDPHVVALHYLIAHSDQTDYEKAPPLHHDEADFSVHIENDKATVVMKNHYSSSEIARTVVEPFLRAWELSATLFDAADNFQFVFQHPEIIDLKPTPGVIAAQGISMNIRGSVTAIAHVKRGQYPSPPTGLARDANVELMLDCYRMWRADRRRLSDAGYFCLTVLERAAGNRKAAAKQFGIVLEILSKIGQLTAQKGGSEARKVEGSHTDFTPAERTWLQEALKMLVRRAAQVAYDKNAAIVPIRLSDLPPLP